MLELTVSGIRADLKAGLTRKEIGAKYGLNGLQVKELFKDENLKGRKTIKNKGIAFVLINDLTAPRATVEPPVVPDEQAPPIEAVSEPDPEVDQMIADEPVVNIDEIGEVAPEPTKASKASKDPVPPVTERKLWE